jgi:hypothetical protein
MQYWIFYVRKSVLWVLRRSREKKVVLAGGTTKQIGVKATTTQNRLPVVVEGK